MPGRFYYAPVDPNYGAISTGILRGVQMFQSAQARSRQEARQAEADERNDLLFDLELDERGYRQGTAPTETWTPGDDLIPEGNLPTGLLPPDDEGDVLGLGGAPGLRLPRNGQDRVPGTGLGRRTHGAAPPEVMHGQRIGMAGGQPDELVPAPREEQRHSAVGRNPGQASAPRLGATWLRKDAAALPSRPAADFAVESTPERYRQISDDLFLDLEETPEARRRNESLRAGELKEEDEQEKRDEFVEWFTNLQVQRGEDPDVAEINANVAARNPQLADNLLFPKERASVRGSPEWLQSIEAEEEARGRVRAKYRASGGEDEDEEEPPRLTLSQAIAHVRRTYARPDETGEMVSPLTPAREMEIAEMLARGEPLPPVPGPGMPTPIEGPAGYPRVGGAGSRAAVADSADDLIPEPSAVAPRRTAPGGARPRAREGASSAEKPTITRDQADYLHEKQGWSGKRVRETYRVVK